MTMTYMFALSFIMPSPAHRASLLLQACRRKKQRSLFFFRAFTRSITKQANPRQIDHALIILPLPELTR